MKIKTLVLGLVFAATLGIAGCSSPHSPVSFKSYEVTPPPVAPTQTYAEKAKTDKIWVTPADLPNDVKYEVIQKLDVGSKWYGSTEKLNKLFAKLARKAGADAVIRVTTWYAPAAFAWAAPQGQGYAVKITSPKDYDITKIGGGWY